MYSYKYTHLFGHINIGSSLHQQLSTSMLTVKTCCEERRLSHLQTMTNVKISVHKHNILAHLVLCVDISPSFNEGPHHLTVSISTSPVQCSVIILQTCKVNLIHLMMCIVNNAHTCVHIHTHTCKATDLVLSVDCSVCCQEDPHHLEVSSLTSQEESC